VSTPEAVAHWWRLARYDLDTAKALLASARYLYVAFLCQQAAEKALKAVFVQRKGTVAPRVHGLIRLAQDASVHMDDRRKDLLARLSPFSVLGRYPPVAVDPETALDQAAATELLAATEELLAWLASPAK
jgi:HEPN domain-containing protein